MISVSKEHHTYCILSNMENNALQLLIFIAIMKAAEEQEYCQTITNQSRNNSYYLMLRVCDAFQVPEHHCPP